MPTETFSESYDLETGTTLGYSINDPIELYTKVADRYRKEAKQLKATSTTGIPQIGKPMQKFAVSTKNSIFFDKVHYLG
jgi:hypothetical protein